MSAIGGTGVETTNDVYRQGGFQPDDWRLVGADEAIPATGRVIVPLKRYLADQASFAADAPIGLLVTGGDTLDDIAGDLAGIPLIAVEFPKFADGRGFSLARLLRERFGYAGAIRAVGDVLLDQIPLMLRVGITEFVVTNEPTRRALLEGRLPVVPYVYQPGWDGSEGPRQGQDWRRKPA